MPYHRRTKIVYLIGTLNIGGSQQQIIETAARLNRELFEPKLYCLFGGGSLRSAINQYGIDVTVFGSNHHEQQTADQFLFRRSRQFFSLYRYLQQQQPDILHCYMYKPCIYGGFAAKLAGNSLLITSRRCLGYFKETKPYYQSLENIVNRFTDGVLVNSEAIKQDVLQRERISPQKIHVVYNGVDITRYKPLDGTTRTFSRRKKRELGIPEIAPVVGMIANLFPYKGYQEFILAASEVHYRYPEVTFLCVGKDCGIQQQLEQLVREHELQKHVIFTGEVQNISEILHCLDIQVSASHEEGFSNAILEGMASGNPIVATSVGGTPEAVLHNTTGLLVPPKDPSALAQAIILLLDNPELALSLGLKGRKRIEKHFSMESMIHTLETWYLKLCERKTV